MLAFLLSFPCGAALPFALLRSGSARRDSRPKKPAPGRFFLTASSGSAPNEKDHPNGWFFSFVLLPGGPNSIGPLMRALGARRRAPPVADTASRRTGQRRRAAGESHGARTAATRRNRESPWKCTRKKRAPNGARFFVVLPPAGRLCRSRFCAPRQSSSGSAANRWKSSIMERRVTCSMASFMASSILW